jgi:uncharacterized protein
LDILYIAKLIMDKLQKLTGKVQKELETAPGCHDWDHTSRVLHNARIIAEGEGRKSNVDMQIVVAAALLHDIGRIEELNNQGKICHADLGFKIAPDILRECGFEDEGKIAKIAECVRRHRYRGKNESPETIEQKIIFDADKLDSIGAVGVARALHFSGRIGSRLHNTEEEATASDAYSGEDSAYREYLVKLRHIPEKMLTETGRQLAHKRAEFMHQFFDTLNEEVYGDR